MAIKIGCQIILKSINNEIIFNIIDLKDPKEMWDKLANTCKERGQGIVYSII